MESLSISQHCSGVPSGAISRGKTESHPFHAAFGVLRMSRSIWKVAHDWAAEVWRPLYPNQRNRSHDRVLGEVDLAWALLGLRTEPGPTGLSAGGTEQILPSPLPPFYASDSGPRGQAGQATGTKPVGCCWRLGASSTSRRGDPPANLGSSNAPLSSRTSSCPDRRLEQ